MIAIDVDKFALWGLILIVIVLVYRKGCLKMKVIIPVVVGQANNYGFLEVAGRLISHFFQVVKSLKRFLDSF